MKKVIYLFILFCVIGCSEKNDKHLSEQENFLYKNQFTKIITEYEKRNGKQKVYQLIIQQKDFEITFLWRSINYYSELRKNMPIRLLFLNNKIILVNCGLSTLYRFNETYFNQLKDMIGNRLEYDLIKNDSIDNNYKGTIHDEEIWKIKILKDSIFIDKDYRELDKPPIPSNGRITLPLPSED